MTIVDLNLQLDFLHYPLSFQYPLLSSQCPINANYGLGDKESIRNRRFFMF
ncbi:MAG: hypothetical protein ACEY3L_18710 [Wolbachia sp.]